MFTDLEQSMYARQLILPELGIAGQQLLKHARVLVVGAGGLGCPVLLQLATAGVGTIGIIDYDVVETTNLHRQTLYTWADIGKPKAACAAAALEKHNPFSKYISIVSKLSFDNVLVHVSNYDVVVDGTDNFVTKYLLNDACLIAQKPMVYGAVSQFEGQVSVFGVSCTANFAIPSLHHFIPFSDKLNVVANCATAGVLGVLPALVGSIQAMETIKIITKIGQPLAGKVLVIDALTVRFQKFTLELFPLENTPTTLTDYQTTDSCASQQEVDIDVIEVQSWIKNNVPFQWIDVREDWEREICQLPGSHLPLHQLSGRLGEINHTIPVVFYCHHGVRSLQAVAIAKTHLAGNFYSLTGGIDAWALAVNLTMPRY